MIKTKAEAIAKVEMARDKSADLFEEERLELRDRIQLTIALPLIEGIPWSNLVAVVAAGMAASGNEAERAASVELFTRWAPDYVVE